MYMDKNKCNSCGEAPHKCSCKNKDFTKAVIEIDNPEQITLMRKVVIPASMGDDTTVPPTVGKYHNVLLYYEANSKSYLYSSDGIPTMLVNGVTDYEVAVNLPQINGVTLLGNKSAADLELADAPMVITVADGNTSWSGADTAEDVYDFFLNKGKVNIIFNGEENYSYEIASAAYIPEEEKMMCTLAVASITGGDTSEFDGNALFGTMTLYTAGKAIDVSQIELQPKLYIADFTGLDLNYNELSGLPATTYSMGMVKAGNGLEVAADGTLSVEDIAFMFDTVADMKASTDLKAGDYARTGGFNSVNDGGGSLYKITDTGTANEMDVIAVGDLYANLIVPTIVTPEMLGAVGDGTTDDTQFIRETISVAKTGSTIMLCNTYKTTGQITVDKKLTITGGGAIKPFIENSTRAFVVTADSVITDITIDGELNTQDQFDQETFSELVLLTGLRFEGVSDIKIDNVTIKNFYGNALQFFGYRQISITNSRIDSVGGHWYQNNTYDAFGDGLYFGGTQGESFININNCIINGKSKNTTLSRCGIVVENLGDSIDTYTHINLNDTKLDNYDRIMHFESIRGTVYLAGKNNNLHGNCIYNYETANHVNMSLDSTLFSYTDNSYNGSYGIVKCTISITNSVIDCSTTGAIGNYGAKGLYENCTFNNITGLQCNSCGALLFKNCVLNVTDDQPYIFYGSSLTFDECTFNCDTDTNQNSNNSSSKVKSCVFNKYIVRSNYLDTNTVIKMSGDYSVTGAIKYTNHATTFYTGDTLIFRPNIASSIPCDNVERYKYETRREVPADGTIPILPTWSENTYRPNTKYALISVGTENWVNIATARNFNGVYLNIITTDSSGVPSIGATQNIGTVPSGNAFTIDDVNHTFARSGTYSNICISYLLEINELEYISTYSA